MKRLDALLLEAKQVFEGARQNNNTCCFVYLGGGTSMLGHSTSDNGSELRRILEIKNNPALVNADEVRLVMGRREIAAMRLLPRGFESELCRIPEEPEVQDIDMVFKVLLRGILCTGRDNSGSGSDANAFPAPWIEHLNDLSKAFQPLQDKWKAVDQNENVLMFADITRLCMLFKAMSMCERMLEQSSPGMVGAFAKSLYPLYQQNKSNQRRLGLGDVAYKLGGRLSAGKTTVSKMLEECVEFQENGPPSLKEQARDWLPGVSVLMESIFEYVEKDVMAYLKTSEVISRVDYSATQEPSNNNSSVLWCMSGSTAMGTRQKEDVSIVKRLPVDAVGHASGFEVQWSEPTVSINAWPEKIRERIHDFLTVFEKGEALDAENIRFNCAMVALGCPQADSGPFVNARALNPFLGLVFGDGLVAGDAMAIPFMGRMRDLQMSTEREEHRFTTTRAWIGLNTHGYEPSRAIGIATFCENTRGMLKAQAFKAVKKESTLNDSNKNVQSIALKIFGSSTQPASPEFKMNYNVKGVLGGLCLSNDVLKRVVWFWDVASKKSIVMLLEESYVKQMFGHYEEYASEQTYRSVFMMAKYNVSIDTTRALGTNLDGWVVDQNKKNSDTGGNLRTIESFVHSDDLFCGLIVAWQRSETPGLWLIVAHNDAFLKPVSRGGARRRVQ